MEKVRLINVSQNKDISDFVDSIDIVMPNTNEISSMVAKFTLEQKLIDTGNEIKIDVLDNIGNTIYSLNGEAKLLTETLNYTNLHNYSYEVKDSYSKLFEKNIAKTEVYYDLYLCNNTDVNNSLMHIIARNLGFKNLEFHNAIYENGQYIRIPFVIFRENEKWIDELQSLIVATNSVLYITAGKLFFKVNNFTLNNDVIFNKTNIITRISKNYKATENNGVKVLYDRYKKLENQVVFNLKSKITVEKNTNKDTEVKSMRISYITSSVAEPSITKATGYYFSISGDVNSKVIVNLIRGVHYVLEEFTETQAVVKFYNPLNYDLIIDNFEIKGIPLVMYTDNSAIIKNRSITEKNQENFTIVNKNKYIQTPELATNIAKQIYRSNISSQFSYNLDTIFINNLQLGEVYNLAFENIDTIGRLISYTIQFKPSDFRLSLKLDEIGSIDNVAVSYTDSLNSNSRYIDLSNIEKSIKENKKELKTIKADINSKLHRMTTTPIENVVENDVWFNPETNVWKKFYNGKWNSISEGEILPTMKLYNSVETNVIKFQNTTDKVGAYLLNNGEKFGSLNGELASVTFDKMGQFEAKNVNNLIALNIKDPANPQRIKSKILLGVTDVNNSRWNDTIFAVGDESSSARLEFKNNKLAQYINGKDLSQKINEVDRDINNLSKGISDSLNTAKSYIDTKNIEVDRRLTNADGRLTQLQQNYQDTVQDVSNFKTQTADRIDTVQGALDNGNFVVNGNTTFTDDVRFVSRGTNEVITIANGSIDFHRNGQKLTRIKNIRYGTIATDSKGKGIVNFDGFKQPMIVLTSIKSANFGKNMASVFCYAEHITGTQYRMFVGGTNEHYVEAKPIKVIGAEWKADNSMEATLLKIEGRFDGRTIDVRETDSIYYALSKNDEKYRRIASKSNRDINVPTFNVKIVRVENNSEIILADNNYKISYSSNPKNKNFTGGVSFRINRIDLSKEMNILKKFSNRTNIKFKIVITITQAHLEVEKVFLDSNTSGTGKNKETYYSAMYYKGTPFTLTTAHFVGLSITASATTSSISDVTGSGEVQYIAMETD